MIPVAGDPAAEPIKLLLVDDRPSNLRSLESLLRRPGYDLFLARSGPEALAHVLRNDFAAVLLDVAMPGMDGLEVASLLRRREQSRSVPIIFITASVFEMKHVFRDFPGGPVDYLRKPLDPDAVRAKVAVFAELYRREQVIARQAARLGELAEAVARLEAQLERLAGARAAPKEASGEP